jgi:hypothetical protein
VNVPCGVLRGESVRGLGDVCFCNGVGMLPVGTAKLMQQWCAGVLHTEQCLISYHEPLFWTCNMGVYTALLCAPSPTRAPGSFCWLLFSKTLLGSCLLSCSMLLRLLPVFRAKACWVFLCAVLQDAAASAVCYLLSTGESDS